MKAIKTTLAGIVAALVLTAVAAPAVAVAAPAVAVAAPAPASALAAHNCDGPPAGTPAQERACTNGGTGTRMWGGIPYVFDYFLCAMSKTGHMNRWARWVTQNPPTMFLDIYVGGCVASDDRP